MAAIVHIHCDHCGACNKPPITGMCLLVPNKPSRGRLPSKVNYVCVSCGERQQKVTLHDADLLRHSGICVATYDVPMEVVEPYPTGPQFTSDDIIELHEELECLS